MATQKQKGGGARKIGRNAKPCERYRLEGRQLKNKRRRLQRHLRRTNGSKRKGTRFLRHGDDAVAKRALEAL